jgi:[acyl-carrier-protein] S-malonyltransferase
MFDLIAECPALEATFAEARKYLGQDPRRLAREGSAADLTSNRVGQMLCCTQALALFSVLPVQRAVIAGYSVGEVAAWGCAGAFDVSTTLYLAERRAAAMDAVAPVDSGLAAVVGLRRTLLESILARHSAYISIVNGAESFVIGARGSALQACCHEVKEHGATRAFVLPVAVPSHTPLLADAVPAFRAALKSAAPRLPRVGLRLISGVDGDFVCDLEIGCDKLAQQIGSTLNWAACLESCRESGARCALELGPGRALSQMAMSHFPPGRVRSSEDFRTLAGLRAWLSG